MDTCVTSNKIVKLTKEEIMNLLEKILDDISHRPLRQVYYDPYLGDPPEVGFYG